jgi:hypothetical protein
MSKRRIDEGVMKYIVKLFFPNLEREILADPKVQRNLKNLSELAVRYNEVLDELEELTGKDYADLKFKRK